MQQGKIVKEFLLDILDVQLEGVGLHCQWVLALKRKRVNCINGCLNIS